MGNNRTIHLMQGLAGAERGSTEHRRFFFIYGKSGVLSASLFLAA